MPATAKDVHRLASLDLYGSLGLSASAPYSAIKKAYRKLARELHPDVRRGDATSSQFLEVQRAYEVLSNPELRALYDQLHTRRDSGVRARSAAHEADRGFTRPKAPPPEYSKPSAARSWEPEDGDATEDPIAARLREQEKSSYDEALGSLTLVGFSTLISCLSAAETGTALQFVMSIVWLPVYFVLRIRLAELVKPPRKRYFCIGLDLVGMAAWWAAILPALGKL